MSMYASTNQKPRSSGIPTPGRPGTGIPTPGRLRSVSSAGSTIQSSAVTPVDDTAFMSRTLADAIRANDPAQHRTSTSSQNTSSLSPSSPSQNYSNLKSISANRPSSVASSVSAVSSVNSRVSSAQNHQIPPRSASRQSNVHGRSVSRAGGQFEIGGDVRIESLGFEGVLRFVGPIEGKPGEWAGVELSGGFAGKGKNDGSANGIKYFVCPPKCGVFVAVDKLSPPAVRTSIVSRPPSVASVRSNSGRVTPSYSGRVTPSISTGRVTPSLPSGRVTPSLNSSRIGPSAGRTTPANRRVTTGPFTTPKTVTKPSIPTNQITPGSRASKYVGVTATQLRKSPGIPRKPPAGRESPTRSVTHSIPSPVRSVGTGSPFNTPKIFGSRYDDLTITGSPTSKSKLSLKTPRPRIPSSVAMPPPSSPSSARLGSGDDEDGPPSSASFQSLHAARMQRTISANSVGTVSPRPGSAASSTVNDWVRQQEVLTEDIARLQSRLDALEYENEELRQKADAAEALVAATSQSRPTSSTDSYTTANSPMIDPTPAADTSALRDKIGDLTKERDSLAQERDGLSTRISTLEGAAKTQERTLAERESKIESLERAVKESTLDLTQCKTDSENRQKELQSKLEDNEQMVKNLKEVLTAKEGLETESGAVLAAKDKEIALLESRIEKASKEWEEERAELRVQVQELRLAGQETIGLYEERLGTSETKRYELEDLVTSLEEQLRAAARPSSPTSLAKYASSAAQIENETLQDQVTHLQNKIRTLEDMLEDARAAAERDEVVVRERIKRYKDKEEVTRKEATEARKEMERLVRAEEQARLRLGEIEEAFRENHLTLENARAEIETLRGELADTEDVRAGPTDRTTSREVTASHEKRKLEEEVVELRQRLERSSNRQAQLEQQLEGGDHDTVAALRRELEERSTEIETLRKKVNREASVTGDTAKSTPLSPSSKYDLNGARDEIKGLKHIIQELQKENQAVKQQAKLMESENQLLMQETEQLRQEMKVLEEDVEKSLQREESRLDAEEQSYPDDVQKVVQELKSKHNVEVEQLRKRMNEVEMKHARVVHDLHKEMSELEALVESKIYREDDLEREIERLKEKLAKSQRKTSKNANGLPAAPSVDDPPASATEGEVCEICERPGHDIFTCDLLKDDGSSTRRKAGGGLYCEDCEGTDHVAADCPHSLDVF